jgi:hypothetical protein
MGMFTIARLLLAGTALFTVGIAIGNAVTPSSAPPHPAIQAGATLAGFMPDEVMSLTYTTPWSRTTAQRSTTNAAFQILSTFALGRTAQRCTASPEMAGRLAELSVVTAERELSPAEREQAFPMLLGRLEIRDSAISDTTEPVLVFANRTRTAVAVLLGGRAAEVTLPAGELGWFETACEGVTSDEPEHKKTVTFWYPHKGIDRQADHVAHGASPESPRIRTTGISKYEKSLLRKPSPASARYRSRSQD